MLPEYANFVFYTERILLKNDNINKTCIDFIEKVSAKNCYFFTHNCDISRQTLFSKLVSNNIMCNFDNVVTPNFLILNYCKNNFLSPSVYQISETKDYKDYSNFNLTQSKSNPSVILISSYNITHEDINLIKNTNVPIVLSSNLCTNRFLDCSNCRLGECSLKYIKAFYNERIIIPDLPPIYNCHHLFNYLNISPESTIVITDTLRDDYLQFQRDGCKLILILNETTTFEDYIKSPFDADLVVDNFDKLSYFLKLKDEC